MSRIKRNLTDKGVNKVPLYFRERLSEFKELAKQYKKTKIIIKSFTNMLTWWYACHKVLATNCP